MPDYGLCASTLDCPEGKGVVFALDCDGLSACGERANRHFADAVRAERVLLLGACGRESRAIGGMPRRLRLPLTDVARRLPTLIGVEPQVRLQTLPAKLRMLDAL